MRRFEGSHKRTQVLDGQQIVVAASQIIKRARIVLYLPTIQISRINFAFCSLYTAYGADFSPQHEYTFARDHFWRGFYCRGNSWRGRNFCALALRNTRGGARSAARSVQPQTSRQRRRH